MNPEKWKYQIFSKYLQISTKLFCSNICAIFSKADLPPDASRLGSKNKLKSAASINFLLVSNKCHLAADQPHK